jgi:hypothetical protein
MRRPGRAQQRRNRHCRSGAHAQQRVEVRSSAQSKVARRQWPCRLRRIASYRQANGLLAQQAPAGSDTCSRLGGGDVRRGEKSKPTSSPARQQPTGVPGRPLCVAVTVTVDCSR